MGTRKPHAQLWAHGSICSGGPALYSRTQSALWPGLCRILEPAQYLATGPVRVPVLSTGSPPPRSNRCADHPGLSTRSLPHLHKGFGGRGGPAPFRQADQAPALRRWCRPRHRRSPYGHLKPRPLPFLTRRKACRSTRPARRLVPPDQASPGGRRRRANGRPYTLHPQAAGVSMFGTSTDQLRGGKSAAYHRPVPHPQPSWRSSRLFRVTAAARRLAERLARDVSALSR